MVTRFKFAVMAIIMMAPCFALGGLVERDILPAGEDSTRFSMLIWGEGPVTLSAEHPDGWDVIIEPSTIWPENGGEMISTGQGYIPASRVDVFVRSSGNGGIVKISVSGTSEQGGITIVDKRTFNLRLVGGVETVKIAETEEVRQETPQESIKTDSPDIGIIAAFIAILVGAAIVYRKS